MHLPTPFRTLYLINLYEYILVLPEPCNRKPIKLDTHMGYEAIYCGRYTCYGYSRLGILILTMCVYCTQYRSSDTVREIECCQHPEHIR